MLNKTIAPYTDVQESPHAYHVVLDMPGVSKDAISIEMYNDKLRVAAAMNKRFHHENAKVVHQEFTKCNYLREMQLSKHVNSDNIEANFENGVLELLLPKKQQLAGSQNIMIN